MMRMSVASAATSDGNTRMACESLNWGGMELLDLTRHSGEAQQLKGGWVQDRRDRLRNTNMVRRRSGEKGAWKAKGYTGGREIAKQHPPCSQSVEAWRRKKKEKKKRREEGVDEGMARRAESWRNNRR